MKLFVLVLCVLIAGAYSDDDDDSDEQTEQTTATVIRHLGTTTKATKPSNPQPNFSQPRQFYQHNQHQQPCSKVDFCDPRSTPRCLKNANQTFCFKDTAYPEKEVQYALQYDPLILKKYADFADQSADNLVDGLTSLSEKHFDYSLYNGNPFAKGNWVGEEGYICPSQVLYLRPARAMNVNGEWRVIVQNIAYYTQTQRVETCLFAGASCRTLAPAFHSKCVQKYVNHRMLSFDPCQPEKGLFIDIFKLPSACSCKIPAEFQ